MFESRHKSPTRVRRPFFLVLLLIAFVFAVSSLAAADEPAEESEHSTEPVVLSETLSEDGEALATEILFPVVADTFITSGLPDNNWGGDPNIRLGYNTFGNGGAERILLRFDFSSIPSNAQINWARFEILMTESNPSNDPPLGLGSTLSQFVMGGVSGDLE